MGDGILLWPVGNNDGDWTEEGRQPKGHCVPQMARVHPVGLDLRAGPWA